MRLLDLIESIHEPERTDIRWAIKKNSQYQTPGQQHYVKMSEPVLVQVNIKDLFSHVEPWQRLDLDDPTGGQNAINGRVHGAKSHWRAGGWMDPSEIYLTNKGINFEDGRHRLVAAHQMGQKWAPVLVPQDQLKRLRKLLRIKTRFRETQLNESYDIIGYWITDQGKLLDASNDSHERVAKQNLGGAQDQGNHPEYYWEDMALDRGWIRIFARSGEFGADMREPSPNAVKSLASLVQREKTWNSYFFFFPQSGSRSQGRFEHFGNAAAAYNYVRRLLKA